MRPPSLPHLLCTLAVVIALSRTQPAHAQTTAVVPPTTPSLTPPVTAAAMLFTGATVPVSIHGNGIAFIDPYVLAGLDARLHIPVGRGPYTVVFEGGAVGTFATSRDGSTSGFEYSVRAGFAYRRFRGTLGVWGRVDPSVVPEVLVPTPSFSLRYDVYELLGDSLGITAGIFDHPGRALFHAGIEHRYFGVSYLGVYGAELYGRVPITPDVLIELRASAYEFLALLSTAGTIGVVWTPGYREHLPLASAARW